MEQRITSLLLPAPEAELEASCKELDEKVTWLLHNSRKMDNYLELEPFSKDGRLCAHVCDTLKSLPETPTLAAYKDYKAIIILLGMSPPPITPYWTNWRNSTASGTRYPN